MSSVISGDQAAAVVALPEYKAYVEAKRAFYAALDQEERASDAACTARDARAVAEKNLKRAQEQLDAAIDQSIEQAVQA